MTLPGALYSLLLAVGAWAVEYFSTGVGSGVPWAPILVAAVPIVLKAISTWLGQEPQAATRGPATSSSKLGRFILG